MLSAPVTVPSGTAAACFALIPDFQKNKALSWDPKMFPQATETFRVRLLQPTCVDPHTAEGAR